MSARMCASTVRTSSVVTTSLTGVQADANTDVVITNVSPSTAGLTGRLRVNQAVVAVLQ